jgi:hypothetical protein
MYTLLASNPEEFIPFFAIFFTFMLPMVAIYFYYKHKSKVMDERRLMIEKGLTPPPLKETFENSNSKTPLSKGLNMIAIALGLLVGYFISRHYGIRGPFSIMGSILFFLGIVNVLGAFLEPKSNQLKSEENENQ